MNGIQREPKLYNLVYAVDSIVSNSRLQPWQWNDANFSFLLLSTTTDVLVRRSRNTGCTCCPCHSGLTSLSPITNADK